MDGVRGCRETGRHRIRLLMAISLCTTPLIPPANKAVHLRVREATDESGAVIHQVPPLSSLHRGASFEFYLQTARSTLSGFSAPATTYRIKSSKGHISKSRWSSSHAVLAPTAPNKLQAQKLHGAAIRQVSPWSTDCL